MMDRFFRRLRNIWRLAFPPTAIRIPGKWPWVQPKVLPMGVVLYDQPDYYLVSDGRGGSLTVYKRLPQPRRPSPRANRGWLG